MQLASRLRASALVVYNPRLAAWCGLFSRFFNVKIPIIAYQLNFGNSLLPSPAKRPIFAAGLSRINRFVVSSMVERQMYAAAFKLAIDRIDFVHWGTRPQHVENPEVPLEKGDYVCAIGGNARDYKTLAESARQLPELRFVLVVRRHNLVGLRLPSNVVAHTDLPRGETMNILMYSRFMVLPLINSTVPNGHETLVAAMHLGKAFIVSSSAGVCDYVHDNGIAVLPESIDSLTAAIRQLWNDPALCCRLGENGKLFASRECSLERVAHHFQHWLSSQEAPVAG